MNCIFCKIDEKQVGYMLTKDNVCICDNCVLVLSKTLSDQLKKDTIETMSKLKNK